ncbi:MAG: hypothetical protein HC918_13610 [Oscillatoriales cyanobacterium SM2_1_8]|nr:hypothetical protein [Oscillatoriales cyanobacterium SM2_1_8]
MNPNPESNFGTTSGPTSERLKEQFLYPKARYAGEFTPANLLFDANLQEFAGRVAIVCALESGGKISPLEAYQEIRRLWEALDISRHQLFDEPT